MPVAALRDTTKVLPGNGSAIDAEVARAEQPAASSSAAQDQGKSAGHFDRDELERIRQSSEKLTPSGFKTLRWLAIVLPVGFIVGLNYLLHTALHRFHDFPGVLVVLALLVGLTAAFSFAVFGLVERLERRILERNAMLAALVAIGREAGASLDLDELLNNSLAAILEITSAEAAEVWLTEGEGELVLAHHRGLAPEAFRETTRLRFGEGLPGLAAEQGEPIVVHDLPGEERFVRTGVRRVGFESFCALPLRHRGETYGVLCVAARDREAMQDEAERGLLEGIAERLAAAIENSRLHERVLDAAVLQERERIARELHDGLAQVLGYINTQTLAVRKLLASGRSDEAGVQLEAMEKAAKQVYADVREGIFNLRTPVGGSDGLAEAVRAHLRNFREMPGAPAALEVVEEGAVPALPPSTEIQLMWIVQEALHNVRNHAEADSATVRFSAANGDGLVVSIEDDGRGFRPEQRTRTGWPHFGLQTMRERAEAIGGRLEIDSESNRGTTVRVRVPLPRQNGEIG
jgi:signal transduction histidine kinase